MAKKVEQQFNDLVKKIEKELKSSVNKQEMVKLATFILNIIKERVRAGFGVKQNGGNKFKFKPLSSAYKKQRSKESLSPFTSPNKSNLTRKGRLIGGLRVFSRTGVAIIKPSGTSSNGESNEKIAEFVSKVRPFLNMSKDEIKQAIEFFEENILQKRIK